MCFHDIPVLFWHVNKERNAELSAGESLTSSYLQSKSGDFSLQNIRFIIQAASVSHSLLKMSPFFPPRRQCCVFGLWHLKAFEMTCI